MCPLIRSRTKSLFVGLANAFALLGEANLQANLLANLVALFVSPRFSGHIFRVLFDSDGRVLSALVLLGSMSLNVVNIYAPNTVSERKTFIECLHDYFISNGSRVIAADFFKIVLITN